MSFRTSLLPVVDAVRSIAGSSGLDVRTNTLTVRTRRWTGSQLKEGVPVDSDLTLAGYYPIRMVSQQEINERDGQYEINDIIVDHITPSNGAGVGYTAAQLNPAMTANNVETIYIVAGSHAGEYGLVEIHTWKPFSYQLVLRRRMTTP